MKRLLLLLLFLAPSAKAVPVVPNFTQGSMTSSTTTRSTVNEVINSMDYNTGYQWSVSGTGVEAINQGSISPSTTNINSSVNGVTNMDRRRFKTFIPNNQFQEQRSVHRDADGTRTQQSYDHRERNDHRTNHRNYKRLYAVVVALLCATPAHAETVGGVSATAAPVANSSGFSDQSVLSRFYRVRISPRNSGTVSPVKVAL